MNEINPFNFNYIWEIYTIQVLGELYVPCLGVINYKGKNYTQVCIPPNLPPFSKLFYSADFVKEQKLF